MTAGDSAQTIPPALGREDNLSPVCSFPENDIPEGDIKPQSQFGF